MKIRSPSLVELHAFLAVCRHRSFHQAADELCVSQAAVSKAVQRLEAHLQAGRLLERTPNGAAPTRRGAQLRQLTERHVAALEAAAEVFRRDALTQSLRISVIPTLGIQWLMPRLSRFRDRFPEIPIEMRQYKHDEDFQRDDVDVWIDVKRPARAWPPHIEARYLLGKELVTVCTPAMRERFASPRDLLGATLLTHTHFPGNWAAWFEAAGVDGEVRLGPSFDLTMNLIIAAKAGMGVAVVPACLIERELQTGELVTPFATEVSCGRGYFLCVSGDAVTFAARDHFVQWLVEEAGGAPSGA